MWALSSSHRHCQVQATVQLLYQRPILGPFDLSVALCPQGPYRLLGTGSPRRPPGLSHSPWALSASWSSSSVLVYVHRERTEYYCVRDGRGGGGGAWLPSVLSHRSWIVGQMMMMMMNRCLMSSDVMRHIRDKLWPMPKHGAINLYVHGNQKAR